MVVLFIPFFCLVSLLGLEDGMEINLIRLSNLSTSLEQMFKYTRVLQLTIFKGTSLLEKEVQPAADQSCSP